jgi:hypothetical protein
MRRFAATIGGGCAKFGVARSRANFRTRPVYGRHECAALQPHAKESAHVKVRTFLCSLAILLSLAACGGTAPASSSTAADEAQSGDPVTLQFAWAPATRMSVTERVMQEGQSSESTFDMAVESDPKGLRVRFSNVRSAASGASQSPDAIMAAIMTAVRSDIVVSSSGALSSVEFDADQFTKALEEALPADATEEQKGLMMGMVGGLARGAAEGQAREDWGDMIETWSGKTLTPGATVKLDRKHQLAMLGDVIFDVSARLEGTTACPDGQGTCAKLVFDAVTRPGQPQQEITVKMRRHFELVADVATLLPHSSVLEVEGAIETTPGQPGEPIPPTRVERTYKRL